MTWYSRRGAEVKEPRYVQSQLIRWLKKADVEYTERDLVYWEQLAHESPSHLHTELVDGLGVAKHLSLIDFLLKVRIATKKDNKFYASHHQ